jgi:hypothetical protein
VSGVRNMSAGISSLARLRSAIKDLPLRIRADVARDAQAILSRKLDEAFDAGQTVYGTSRPVGVQGNPLSLVASGKTRSALAFVAIGTIVRAQLNTRYAKYLVGKYQILPQRLPSDWSAALSALVAKHRARFQAEVAR